MCCIETKLQSCFNLLNLNVEDHQQGLILNGTKQGMPMLTWTADFPTPFNISVVTRAAVKMVGSGTVPASISGPAPTGTGTGLTGPGRPASIT